MAVADAEVEVLIVGGGPVGLTARALLERWGVRAMLVEKYAELSPFPRSRLLNVRSMEIFRQLGLAGTIAAGAFAPEYGRIRFRDTLYDRDFASAGMVGINEPIEESPVIGALTSQDRLEPTLLAAADTEPRFGVELIDLVEEPDGVVASLVDHLGGAPTRVRARYVLAADGANSTVRQRLGVGTVGPGALGRVTTVVFDADLSRWSAQQPAGVYATAHGSFLPLYPEGGWAWIGPAPGDAEGAVGTDWAGVVSGALGPEAGVPVEVLRVQHWVINAFIAERFRHGRVLLAGDAAHAIPPSGGMGMNVGIADVHNLCWKLAGVLRGWAGPDLLDSYDTERQPVAHLTLRQAVANTQLSMQAMAGRRAQLESGDVAGEVELPWSDRYFAQLGLVLGVRYSSDAVLTGGVSTDAVLTGALLTGAVLTDDSAPPEPSDPGTDYVPTPAPGHRMPHAWLAPGRSTLDAIGEWFTLFTPDPDHWGQHATAPWPLRVEPLPDSLAEFFGLGPHGALLVRPDGHIGAHWPDRPASESVLAEALATITGSAARDAAATVRAGATGLGRP